MDRFDQLANNILKENVFTINGNEALMENVTKSRSFDDFLRSLVGKTRKDVFDASSLKELEHLYNMIQGLRSSDEDVEIEDQEIKTNSASIDIERGLQNLASKAESGAKGMVGRVVGTSAQKAKKALKDREEVYKHAVPIYQQETQKMKDAMNLKMKEMGI